MDSNLSFCPSFSLPDVICDSTDLTEEMDPICGDDWSHSSFIRRSPSWGFPGFASAVRQMHSPRDHFIIILIISDSRDTRGKWPLYRNPDGSWWHRHTSLKLFWPQPMAPWTTCMDKNEPPWVLIFTLRHFLQIFSQCCITENNSNMWVIKKRKKLMSGKASFQTTEYNVERDCPE